MSICSCGASRDPLPNKIQFVSVDDASAMLGVGRTTAWKLIREKRLKTLRLGRKRLVLLASIEQLVSEAT